ncbi:methionyl-tRNA formyltransferase [Sphingomonas naasensis]|uniref:Methionyl-tRNA formyltransferase n=1 Tax=Sphingomonas naasensis TaxID=1344951 RepID=A0A4S1WSV1_9SPHN|nr:formyltransferase family protein [Sphingomonas naasensis]NIJ19296.1 methionyl-tRNA formyltransferase [Sphingomonas naasensis]TGX46471.1 hypothetical protein E5A74_04810 [Sphingomonas naasensis]
MARRGILFLGSKAAGLRICKRVGEMPAASVLAVVCPDEKGDPRSVEPEFRALAAEAAVPFHISTNTAQTVELIERYEPSVVLVHGWYQIIPVDRFPSTQFFGFHYSPLPRYRGNAPLVWQIIAGEQQIGVSLFEMVAEMDAGRLFEQAQAPLAQDETIADALAKADALAESMVDRFVTALQCGRLALRDQPDAEPSYCGLRVPEDGAVDWSWSGLRIHDFVRAQSRPYPGAFTVLADGRRMTIWRTEPEPRFFMGAPGAVAEIGLSHVVVTAGTGAVRLVEVELERGQSVAASSVLRSLRLRLG